MSTNLFPDKYSSKPLIATESAKKLKNKLNEFFGLVLFCFGLILFFTMTSYNIEDPSFRNATNLPAKNIFGSFGSFIADPLHLALGNSSFVISLFFLIWSWRFIFKKGKNKILSRIIYLPLSIIFVSLVFSSQPPENNWVFPYGLGGMIGDTLLTIIINLRPVEINLWLKIISIASALFAIIISLFSCGFSRGEIKFLFNMYRRSLINLIPTIRKKEKETCTQKNINPIFSDNSSKILNKNTLEIIENVIQKKKTEEINNSEKNEWKNSYSPKLGGVKRENKQLNSSKQKSFEIKNHFFKNNKVEDETDNQENKNLIHHKGIVSIKKSLKAKEEEQPRLKFENKINTYQSPPLSLLENSLKIKQQLMSHDALNENARMLENVLDDYGIKGHIVAVRPGPVVTLYELEPAAGLKASRVISLSDDIARSMSALSARVSTIPGRSVIGIELPNPDREKVLLRELLSSKTFGDSKFPLPLALGKDIEGAPFIANLSKMPHLLIAGTTGSGKSVGINTMILSLLYRLNPDECRLIMIDPKMLELSVYDDIPHLLSPVVTDPKKAIVALKWAVAEMEERYRKMSKIGVRNIESYNLRVKEAIDDNEEFSRKVQTGFDDETGEPVFEVQHFKPEKMPYIVIIVDEMADLMMVAGKEIEACIQRLAQMARAAGIHLIMATQRPSVDVITGTIKANFPTRVSFQVTSKVDSRTILGEMGAEQLLGMGDMLFMANGGRITRIHSPFVSDQEVEEVVSFLKTQGKPNYVSAVIEGPSPEEEAKIDETIGLSSSDNNSEDELYDYAVSIVANDRKCSTSYIQRKLSIGYNRAAKIVEKMEEQGIVSSANHVGKRDILIPEKNF